MEDILGYIEDTDEALTVITDAYEKGEAYYRGLSGNEVYERAREVVIMHEFHDLFQNLVADNNISVSRTFFEGELYLQTMENLAISLRNLPDSDELLQYYDYGLEQLRDEMPDE